MSRPAGIYCFSALQFLFSCSRLPQNLQVRGAQSVNFGQKMTPQIHFIPVHSSLVGALADELLKETGQDFSGHLIILPNQRLQQYLHLELAERVEACIPPRVVTLESIARLLAPTGTVRILQGQEEAIILNALLNEGDFATIKPGMERDLARFFTEFADEALDAHTLEPVREFINGDIFHDDVHRRHVLDHIDELETLLNRFHRLLQENGLMTAAEFFLRQAKAFDPEQENPFLPHTVHIAGFGDATGAQIVLLKKLLQRPGTHLWLHTDSALFHATAQDEAIGPGRPLRALLQALELPAPPADASQPPHNTLLARAAFDLTACTALPEEPARVTIHEAMSPITEVKSAVALLRRVIIEDRVPPERIILCVPDPSRYGRLVRSLCLQAGVPINYSLAIPLDQTQIGQWLHLFCRLVVDDCPLRTMLDLFNNQYFRSLFAEDEAVVMRGALKALAIDNDLHGGLENFRQAARGQNADILNPLFEKLHAFLAPFDPEDRENSALTLAEWAERMRTFTRDCAFEQYLAQDPARDAYNLESRAMNHWYSGLQILERSGEFLANRLSRYEFFTLLRQNILGVELRPAGEPFVGVQVMGLLEARNVPAQVLIIIGLTEGGFPAKISRELFLAEPVRRHIGLTTFHKREHLQDQQFFHLLAAHEQVHLFYPRQDQEAPFVPSRYVQRLRLINTRRPGCVREKGEEGLLFRDDYLRLAGSRIENSALSERLRSLQQSVEQRNDARGHYPGSREEIFQHFPGTHLEYLLQCPYRFLLMRAGLRDLDLPTEESDARSVGRWLHLVCQTFFTGLPQELQKRIPDPDLAKGWRRPVTPADREQAVERLCRLSRALLPLAGGKVDMQLYLEFSGWQYFAEREAERGAWTFHEEDFERELDQPIALEKEGQQFTCTIKGRIDRIIRAGENVTVLDYKNSKGSISQNNIKTTKLPQLVLYSLMLHNLEEFRQQNFALEYFIFKSSEHLGLDKTAEVEKAWQRLEKKWAEALFPILLEEEPFEPRVDIKERGGHCTYCSFNGICRREETVYRQQEEGA